MLRVIRELRPAWVVGENVAGIVNMALDEVLSDLEGIGYACQAFIIPACAVDAPHRRDRCAIVAHADSTGQQRREQQEAPSAGGQAEPHGPACKRGYAANTDGPLLESAVTDEDAPGWAGLTDKSALSDTHDRRGTLRWNGELPTVENPGGSGADHGGGAPERGGGERRTAQSGMGGGYDGVSSWMDGVRTGWADGSWEYGIERIARDVPERVNRLKCLGNAVVPAQFYPIFCAIAEAERNISNEIKKEKEQNWQF